MINIVIEVSSDDARFRTAVRAGSIREAVGLVRSEYPHAEARVVYPIDPDSFFAREAPANPAGSATIVGTAS